MLHSADETNIICKNLWCFLNTTLLFFILEHTVLHNNILFCLIFGIYQDGKGKLASLCFTQRTYL